MTAELTGQDVATASDPAATFDDSTLVLGIASRAHLDVLNPVIARTIVEAGVDEQRIDAVACTIGPGLIGALLVGVSAAKALAMAWDVPFVGVNHMEAHLYAASLEDPTLEFPLLVLLVSGGHTMLVEMQGHGRYRLVGQTIDDAAGEAFDKVARFLDLGYPGGPAIDRAALDGDPEAIRFPRAIMDDGYDFSFSGLKTAVVNYVRKHPDVSSDDVAASFQAAVVDVLVTKARRAAAEVGATGIVLGGGVAANSLLREQILDACEHDGIQGFLPSRAMCTDNAAMVADASDHPEIADLARVHAVEGIGDIATEAAAVPDGDVDGAWRFFLAVIISSPVRCAFVLEFALPRHRQVLDEAAVAGRLVIATTPPERAELDRPLWLAIDLDPHLLSDALPA